MEKWQIKNANNKYVSIGMDGKPKWFESPDMGYTYTKEEAETFKVILEGMEFKDLSVVLYDKDWWKEKLNSGGSDSELAMGIEVEKEHIGTLQKLVDGKISLEEAPKYIAKDHLEEDPKYYTKLVEMESKFSGGGPTAEGMLKIINQDPTVITSARITAMPTELLDDMPQVYVTINGKEEYLFEYYPDELTFTPEEFIGLTTDEARHLKFEKDKMYLQSHSYSGGGDFLLSTDLYNRSDGHNKEYHIQIKRRGNGFIVVAQYGAIGSLLRDSPAIIVDTYAEAEKEFFKVKKSKLHKGYVEQGGGIPKPEPKPEPKPVPTFNTGDYFTTSSGDKYQIKSIHSSGSRMQYESVSGIKTSIDLSTAIRFFEEGSWKLEKDEPKESELIGKKVKIVFADGDEDIDTILKVTEKGKNVAIAIIWLESWKKPIDVRKLDDFINGQEIDLGNGLSIQLSSFAGPKKKLTIDEYYAKFGY